MDDVLTVKIPGIDVNGLVQGFQVYHDGPAAGTRFPWSYPRVLDLAAHVRRSDLVPIARFPGSIPSPTGPQTTWIEATTTLYPAVSGVRPLAGRWFTEEENRVPLRDGVIVLGYELCRAAFATVQRCLGASITVGGMPLTIVGVMPPRFRGFSVSGPAGAWTPLMLAPLGIGRKDVPFRFWVEPDAYWVTLIGRVRPNASMKDARAEFATRSRPFAESHGLATPATSDRLLPKYELVPVGEALADPLTRRAGQVIGMGILLVLLVACGNAAMLMLARIHARARSFAVEITLGATSLRLAISLALEALCVGASAAGLGYVLAAAAVSTMATMAGAMDSIAIAAHEVQIGGLRSGLLSGSVTVAAAMLTAFTAAMIGGWHTLRREYGAIGWQTAAASPITSFRLRPWQRAILVVQVAGSLFLGVVAGLVGVSYYHAVRTPLGFDANRLIAVKLPSSPSGIAAVSVTSALSIVPGVTGAARVSCVPLSRTCLGTAIRLETPSGGRAIGTTVNYVDAAAFRLLNLTLLQGEAFTAFAQERAHAVVVVNQVAAAELAIDGAVVGRRVSVGDSDATATIVGVVSDVKYDGLTERVKPTLYVPWTNGVDASETYWLASTSGVGAAPIESMRRQLRDLDRDFETASITPMASAVREALVERRLQMAILVAFTMVALSVCAAGILGTTRFAIGAGAGEMALRVALGAAPGALVRMVCASVGRVVAIGVGAGLAMVTVASRWWAPLLYDVDPLDATVVATTAAVVVGSALANVFWVGRQMLKHDPAAVLRSNR